MRPLPRVMLLLVVILFAGANEVRAQAFECRQVMVPMRDGVKLATDLYLPTRQGPGPFPTVIERTPYNKSNCTNASAQYFAKRGYVAIVQDERGRFASEGIYYWLRDEGWGERRDGYDTIEWAASQPWSNGKIGTLGLSFSCLNQYMTAVARPPHLSAMFCAFSASNAYKDLYYAGGAIHMIMPTWLLTRDEMAKPLNANLSGRPGYLGTTDAWLDWYARKQEASQTFGQSMLTSMLTDMLRHPYYDEYWRQFAIDEHWGEIDVPIFHYAAWYDRYPHSQLKHFNGIAKVGGPKARGSQKLMFGPWTHSAGEITSRIIGDIDFGPEAAIDYNALRMRWFDYHLKGIENGIMKEAPVRIFVLGANAWRDEREFPLARTKYTDYYFSGARANSIESLNDGTLSTSRPGAEQPEVYQYDPKQPVQSVGGDLFIEPMGARDHAEADRRSLTYTTAPLDADVEVTGQPTVEFFASSSAVDTDWVVTITDVHPNGYSQILRENILRARYREGDQKPVLMKPGTVYKFGIEMYPISNLFKRGHRIRVGLTSSSFPKWFPNGNTGRELDQDMPVVIATNTIYHDATRPSRIVLPIIPPASGTAGGK